ncbi:uncharacterized protein LOC18103914 isoform X1 [Populus trichocarpa]|uniref:Large ribosomal subunit protein bL9c n=3 Tax=Populus trichocarpa TaxID=3694 RepID=A0A2K1R799_POPTR|nr:uncharacterized protein LOC18103914 isoform X1 [Populus trichocarpa]|eukprot:XP_024448515.1 uncharacterized protein LOC18103914 isoform X1 [Populus trichocarpa]
MDSQDFLFLNPIIITVSTQSPVFPFRPFCLFSKLKLSTLAGSTTSTLSLSLKTAISFLYFVCLCSSSSLHSASYVLSRLASLYQGLFVVIMACIQHSRNALRRIVAKETNLKSSDGAIHPLLYACQGVRYKKLEVILTTSIEKLGKAGQTVKVAPGHFRNHLMPKLLAVPNIEKFAHLIREQRKIYQPEEEEEVKVVKETMEDKMKEYETAAKRLVKAQLAFRVGINTAKFRARESKDDPIEILSPVTKDDILKEVTRQFNVQIEPDNVHLPSPLTALGEFEVPLRFPKSIPMPEGKVKWTLKVKIRGK